MLFYSIHVYVCMHAHVCVCVCVCVCVSPNKTSSSAKIKWRKRGGHCIQKRDLDSLIGGCKLIRGQFGMGLQAGLREKTEGVLGSPGYLVVTNTPKVSCHACPMQIRQPASKQWLEPRLLALCGSTSESLTFCYINSTHILLAKTRYRAPVRWKGSWEKEFCYWLMY